MTWRAGHFNTANGCDALFKGILARRGLPIEPAVRGPLLPATSQAIERCWRAMQELDLTW